MSVPPSAARVREASFLDRNSSAMRKLPPFIDHPTPACVASGSRMALRWPSFGGVSRIMSSWPARPRSRADSSKAGAVVSQATAFSEPMPEMPAKDVRA
jgi:hypothetical protein